MREDYGNMALVTNDDGFGDMGFDTDAPDLMRHASGLEPSIEQVGLSQAKELTFLVFLYKTLNQFFCRAICCSAMDQSWMVSWIKTESRSLPLLEHSKLTRRPWKWRPQ